MRERIFIKCIVVAVAAASSLALFAFRSAPSSRAESDVILAEIAQYKSWTKVNERPIEPISLMPTLNQNSNPVPVSIVAGEGG